MIRPVAMRPRRPEAYLDLLPPDLYEELRELAEDLAGLSVIHVSATPKGGGVAELLSSIVPLAQGLGVDMRWYVMVAPPAFFAVTKLMHNLLQGKEGELRPRQQQTYLRVNEAIAAEARTLGADVWVVQDPQPAPLAALGGTGNAPAIWHCHIDTSTPNPSAASFLAQFLKPYQALIFSLPEYAFPGVPEDRLVSFPPAIDPLTPKNRPLPRQLARGLLAHIGLDPARPIATQVSRFDPWKDPLGVIDAYRLARHEAAGLQLALVGALAAQDDPEAAVVLREVELYAQGDPDIHLFWDPDIIGALEVNAFQAGSDLVLQKSIREGFGLTVSEAMWKGQPVIGSDWRGNSLQLGQRLTSYIVLAVEQCAARMVELLQSPERRAAMGDQARERVRRSFLIPRMLRDYLHLLVQLAGHATAGREAAAHTAEQAGPATGAQRSEAA